MKIRTVVVVAALAAIPVLALAQAMPGMGGMGQQAQGDQAGMMAQMHQMMGQQMSMMGQSMSMMGQMMGHMGAMGGGTTGMGGIDMAQAMPGMNQPAMPMMGQAGMPTDAKGAYQQANQRMMTGMTANLTGDADKDFAALMLPHHQGAVEMAQIELQYSKDPVLRALAEAIVKAQQDEIALMKKWQADHAK